MSVSEDAQIIEIMTKVFPGYEQLPEDSVTPSISGHDQVVISFLIVCNDEAALDFMQTDEIAADVFASVSDNRTGAGLDLNLRFEFTFELFTLQFFTTVEASAEQQSHFVGLLHDVDFFVVWLVDKDKNLLKILQVRWDKERERQALEALR